MSVYRNELQHTYKYLSNLMDHLLVFVQAPPVRSQVFISHKTLIASPPRIVTQILVFPPFRPTIQGHYSTGVICQRLNGTETISQQKNRKHTSLHASSTSALQQKTSKKMLCRVLGTLTLMFCSKGYSTLL